MKITNMLSPKQKPLQVVKGLFAFDVEPKGIEPSRKDYFKAD